MSGLPPASRLNEVPSPFAQTTFASSTARPAAVPAGASAPIAPLPDGQANAHARQKDPKIAQANTEAKQILGTGLVHMWSRDEWTRYADEVIAQLPNGTQTAGLVFLKFPCAIVESIANIGGFIGLFFSGMERYRQEAAGAYAKEMSNLIVDNKTNSLTLELAQARWNVLHRNFLERRAMFNFVNQNHLFRQTLLIFEENYPQ